MNVPLPEEPQAESQQIEKFPEECKNCIFAWVSGDRRPFKNIIFALRDSRKTVSGGNFSIY